MTGRSVVMVVTGGGAMAGRMTVVDTPSVSVMVVSSWAEAAVAAEMRS
jgi:hypothetical protein